MVRIVFGASIKDLEVVGSCLVTNYDYTQWFRYCLVRIRLEIKNHTSSPRIIRRFVELSIVVAESGVCREKAFLDLGGNIIELKML